MRELWEKENAIIVFLFYPATFILELSNSWLIIFLRKPVKWNYQILVRLWHW